MQQLTLLGSSDIEPNNVVLGDCYFNTSNECIYV